MSLRPSPFDPGPDPLETSWSGLLVCLVIAVALGWPVVALWLAATSGPTP